MSLETWRTWAHFGVSPKDSHQKMRIPDSKTSYAVGERTVAPTLRVKTRGGGKMLNTQSQEENEKNQEYLIAFFSCDLGGLAVAFHAIRR